MAPTPCSSFASLPEVHLPTDSVSAFKHEDCPELPFGFTFNSCVVKTGYWGVPGREQSGFPGLSVDFCHDLLAVQPDGIRGNGGISSSGSGDADLSGLRATCFSCAYGFYRQTPLGKPMVQYILNSSIRSVNNIYIYIYNIYTIYTGTIVVGAALGGLAVWLLAAVARFLG